MLAEPPLWSAALTSAWSAQPRPKGHYACEEVAALRHPERSSSRGGPFYLAVGWSYGAVVALMTAIRSLEVAIAAGRDRSWRRRQ